MQSPPRVVAKLGAYFHVLAQIVYLALVIVVLVSLLHPLPWACSPAVPLLASCFRVRDNRCVSVVCVISACRVLSLGAGWLTGSVEDTDCCFESMEEALGSTLWA